jgi:hypothetical protein
MDVKAKRDQLVAKLTTNISALKEQIADKDISLETKKDL